MIGGSIAGKTSAAFLSKLSISKSSIFSEIVVIEQSQSNPLYCVLVLYL